MDAVPGLLGVTPEVAVVMLIMGLVIGGPVLLVDWLQNRRRETVERQIALTDAIYEKFGSIASPVVKRPLWGPQQIQFAVQPAEVGNALFAAHEVLSLADRMNLGRYEIVLVPCPSPAREAQGSRTHRPAVGWPRDTRAAA
jgi:hypothetical protein